MWVRIPHIAQPKIIMSELPSCYTSKWRVSRKPHRCCECRGIIFYKERYHYFSGIWDGRADSYKTCQDCYNIREELRLDLDLDYDEELPFGELYSYIGESSRYKHFVFLKKYIDVCDKRGVRVRPEYRQQLKGRRIKY